VGKGWKEEARGGKGGRQKCSQDKFLATHMPENSYFVKIDEMPAVIRRTNPGILFDSVVAILRRIATCW